MAEDLSEDLRSLAEKLARVQGMIAEKSDRNAPAGKTPHRDPDAGPAYAAARITFEHIVRDPRTAGSILRPISTPASASDCRARLRRALT